MVQGIYLATQGMTALMQKQDQISNNLANINTTGFKQSHLFTEAYQRFLTDDENNPRATREIKADQVYTDYSEGTMKKSNQPLDVMIKGTGFFKVMTPDGVRYTRNGSFSMNPEGFLVTGDGGKVMSREGYVRLDTRYPVQISPNGEVIQDGTVGSVLKIVDFNKPYRLLRTGSNYFMPQMPDNPETEPTGFALKQGFLEGSNVNVIKNMVQMISAFRNYEADQKALLAQDETLQKAVSEVGRVR